MVANRDMVVSKPTTVGLGDGLTASTFTVQISNSNVNIDPGCPPGVQSCLSFLWIARDHVFAIGYGEAVRLYLVTIGSGTAEHTLVVALDTPDEASLAKMTIDVTPVLRSIRLP
jgi:hypothetical protein